MMISSLEEPLSNNTIEQQLINTINDCLSNITVTYQYTPLYVQEIFSAKGRAHHCLAYSFRLQNGKKKPKIKLL